MGRRWVISDKTRSELWDRYMGGESALRLSYEYGVTADSVRKALKAEALNRCYAGGLRLDEIRKSKVRRNRKSRYDEGRSSFGVCRVCGRVLAGHARCKVCEVLLHEANPAYTCDCGKQHGVYRVVGMCVACEVGYDEAAGIYDMDDGCVCVGVDVSGSGVGGDGEFELGL